jgi:flagellar protein FliT
MTSTPALVLDIYKSIAHITEAMLSAAQENDWGKVVDYGKEYCLSVERLRNIESGEAPLDTVERGVKYDLLVQILDNDAAVRDLASPQLKRLGQMLGRMRRQQSLMLAYQGRTNSL